MDRLTTPWRYDYVTGRSAEGCVFCTIREAADDAENFVLHRGRDWYVMLNRYPYNNGHLLLVANRHQPLLGDCTPRELGEMGQLLAVMERTLRLGMNPHGLNCGYNGGASAGAGIPEHLHLHLLPRWQGDTNFMTTVGETRVMPQSLDQVYRQLQPLLVQLLQEAG